MLSYFVNANACLTVTCMVSPRLYLVVILGTASFFLLVKHFVRELSINICCCTVWSVFLCYSCIFLSGSDVSNIFSLISFWVM